MVVIALFTVAGINEDTAAPEASKACRGAENLKPPPKPPTPATGLFGFPMAEPIFGKSELP
jgi:hypothetical protein